MGNFSKQFKIALGISILLHILIVLFFQYAQNILNLSKEEATPIEVFLQQPDGGWKLADIPEPKVQQKPDKTKFLGMYNQKVREETVAKSQPLIRGEGSGKKEEGRRGKGERGEKQEARSKKQEVAKKDSDIYAMKEPYKKKSKKELNELSSGAPIGSQAQMPEDYYPDYKYGDHTYINVLRYPEVEYFVRLKRIFKMTWNPVSALRADMQGMSVSRGQVSVVLAVSVDKKGGLSELFVLRSSGLPHYDNEAIRTVRSSSPFSAPPSKFVEKDGMLHMSWTFVVYI